MAPRKSTTKIVQVCVKVDAAFLRRMEQHGPRLTKKHGKIVNRADIVRHLLVLGLESLEADG
jgi:hypothetical protein